MSEIHIARQMVDVSEYTDHSARTVFVTAFVTIAVRRAVPLAEIVSMRGLASAASLISNAREDCIDALTEEPSRYVTSSGSVPITIEASGKLR